MGDLEKKPAEEKPKKLLYGIREKKDDGRVAKYRMLLRPALVDDLYDKILNTVVVQRRYREVGFTSKKLAHELKTNTRYLSAVVNTRFGKNYSCFINEYRIKDALQILSDERFARKTMEEVGTMVGFANRQSFYAAFYRNIGESPAAYKHRILNEAKRKKQ